MSRSDGGVWSCTCGRQVPARFDECHCGVTRAQALAVARADAPPPRKPLTMFGLAWRLGGAAIVLLVGVSYAIVYFPSQPPPVRRPAPPPLRPVATAAPTRAGSASTPG